MDNFSPHLSTKVDSAVGDSADANNVELAYVPTNASWTNRIEAQFQALRYFTLDGTDHRSHEEQNSMIRRYIIWRNRNAQDKTLRELVARNCCLMRHLVYATDAFATLLSVEPLFHATPNSRPDDHGEGIQDDPDVPAAAALRSVNESS